MSRGSGTERESKPHLGIVAALHREVAPLLRRQREVERHGPALYRFLLNGEPVVLAIAGVGDENAWRAARELIRDFPLRALISVGFAGGLSWTAETAALVVAEEIIEEATGKRYRCSAELLPAAPGLRGSLLCAREVIGSAEQKRLLGQQWGALAVDMESAGVARAAQEAALPCAAFKTITDSSEQSIGIDFQRCRSDDGRFSSWKILREGLASPGGVRALCRLAGNSRRAANKLAVALGAE